jgi:hypothetical protein
MRPLHVASLGSQSALARNTGRAVKPPARPADRISARVQAELTHDRQDLKAS